MTISGRWQKWDFSGREREVDSSMTVKSLILYTYPVSSFGKRGASKGKSTVGLKPYKILCFTKVCALVRRQDSSAYDSQLQIPLSNTFDS